jgi:transcriptional regulator with XRE-family HTH domain
MKTNLQRAISARGTTQVALAKALGVTKTLICHLCHGRRRSYRLRPLLATLLNADESWLFPPRKKLRIVPQSVRLPLKTESPTPARGSGSDSFGSRPEGTAPEKVAP